MTETEGLEWMGVGGDIIRLAECSKGVLRIRYRYLLDFSDIYEGEEEVEERK